MFKIVRKQTFADDGFLLEIDMPAIAERARPGHHVDIHLNPDAPVLTLPVSDADPEKGTFVVVHRGLDRPSEQLMLMQEGDEVFQVRGPLGAGCEIHDVSKIVLIAEDLGVASLYPRLREYKAKDCYTIVVIGFKTREHAFWETEIDALSDEFYIATADGSYGVHGDVIGPLRAIAATHKDIERVIVIGQLKSMKRAAKITADHGLSAYMCFDAVRQPVDVPSIFEQKERARESGDAPRADGGEALEPAQQSFTFAKAAEINADDIDFDKLIARQKAIRKQAETTDSPEANPTTSA